jgi:large subunit ribosomal protein L5
MEKARFEQLYLSKIRSELKNAFVFENDMQIPRVVKIVVNVGAKKAVSDSKVLPKVEEILKNITGQLPVRTLARKSNASFKLREGMAIGAKVTLRRKLMYEFLDRLITLALPRIRDFQGVTCKFDGRGSYNLGLTEWSIFPEVDFAVGQEVSGMNITIHTSARNDEHGFKLLELFGMPFKKNKAM